MFNTGLRALLAILALSFTLAPGLPAAAPQDKDELADLIKAGFETLAKKSVEEAVGKWLKDSPAEPDSAQVAGPLEQVVSLYGPADGSDIVKSASLTGRIRVVYAVSYHAKGPCYYKFRCFRTTKGSWIVTHLGFNLDLDQVIPESMYGK